jgi:hypothetical protein
LWKTPQFGSGREKSLWKNQGEKKVSPQSSYFLTPPLLKFEVSKKKGAEDESFMNFSLFVGCSIAVVIVDQEMRE